MRQIFYNDYGRLRSGWRFIFFLLAFLFLSTFFGLILQMVLVRLPVEYNQDSLFGFAAPFFVFAAAAILLGWLCGKIFEDLPFKTLGLSFTKNWLKDLILGLILGALSVLFAALIGIIFGGLTIQTNQTHDISQILSTLGISLAIFTVGAVSEETLFRGVILQTFFRAKLVWFAIVLTSVFFALVHLDNTNVSYISTANTFLAGIWFGVAYLKTRNLWFPIGLHLAWNWFQGAILGIQVSGIQKITLAPLLQAINTGPTWLTGGNYGVEGGIACTIALIVSMVLIWFLPFLKPTEEMLALTSEENPLRDEKIVNA